MAQDNARITYPSSLRVTSLNCWGLKYISTHRAERLTQIGRELASATPHPDIVALQECWTQVDYECIRSLTSDILPYGKYYHSGIFGGGLVILSRFPIEESNMYRYPLNGRPTAFFRGDWFVGKGVASASIRLGPQAQDIVEVLNTHLHAPYESGPNDSYVCHRTAQAWEIAKLARAASLKGRTVIALGDFNMVPSSLAHTIVTVHGGLKDVWQTIHPESSIAAAEDGIEKARGRGMPSVEFNLSENGTTCDSLANTWRMPKKQQKQTLRGKYVAVDMESPDSRAKRLDYIFLSNNSLLDHQHERRWSVKSTAVGMIMRHPELQCSLSDHFSVECEFTITPVQRTGDSENRDQHRTQPESEHLLTTGAYAEVQKLLTQYVAREQRQRVLRLGHFVVSIIVSIGCQVAVWWSPRNYVSFILMLLSTLSLSAGTIDGLIGGFFMGSEIRALREFEWEIECAKTQARQMGVWKR